MKPHILTLQTIDQGEEGFLTVAEFGKQLPFVVRRAYWMYDATLQADRGHQANCHTEHVLIPLKGGFVVELESPQGEHFSFELDTPNQAVYIPPKHWRKVKCTQDSIILSFASKEYDSTDIIRDYEQWKHTAYQR